MTKPDVSTTEDIKPAANASDKPMTESEFLASRVASRKARTSPAEAPKPQAEPEPKKETEAATTPKEEGKSDASEPSKAVLSKDVSELTDEDIAELAKNGKSGLLKRVAELTAKRKLAEERAQYLEQIVQNQNAKAHAEPKVENNPYEKLSTPQEIEKERKDLDEYIDWAESALDRSEGLPGDAIIASGEGKEFSRSSVKDALRNARKRKDKYLPAQERELSFREQRTVLERQFSEQARKEIPWMSAEGDDTKKRYDMMVSDSRIKRVKETVPELAPQLDYLIAHAANSMFGRRLIPMDEKPAAKPVAQPSLTPPSNPSSSAGAPEKVSAREEGALKDYESRFQKSGRSDDFVALRTAQLKQRKNVK